MSRRVSRPERGIALSERTSPAHRSPIRNAILPSTATVALSQHIGAPAECVVRVGDRVREGSLIGRPNGLISSSVHSPIPGVVTSIRTVVLPGGERSEAVVIALEGGFDRPVGGTLREPPERSSEELLSHLARMGVVGLGGAGLPTHLKLRPPKGLAIDLLIVNGAECEPYLSADFRLMVERPGRILAGAAIAARLLGAKAIRVAVRASYPEAIESMRAEIRGGGLPMEIVPVSSAYPAGDERALTQSVGGRRIPSGARSADVGVVVVSVATLAALHDAVALERPLFERVVTVAGGAVAEPANLKARIGTPIGALLEECGGFLQRPERILVGGPFSGSVTFDLDTPVTKRTTAVLALTSEEVKAAAPTPCINCGRCEEACPRELVPDRLLRLVERDRLEDAAAEGLAECNECGCCSYVCPAHLPLVESFRRGKLLARNRGVA